MEFSALSENLRLYQSSLPMSLTIYELDNFCALNSIRWDRANPREMFFSRCLFWFFFRQRKKEQKYFYHQDTKARKRCRGKQEAACLTAPSRQGDRRQKTVSQKLVWLFGIWDLEFGIFLIWRFDLPRLRKIRLSKEVEVEREFKS